MSAGAPEVAQLPPDIQAAPLQRGEVVLLNLDGQPSTTPTQVPAGWYYTQLGHHRLNLAVSQLQADRAAAEARATALQYALDTRAPAEGGGYGYAAALLAGALLLGLGVVIGRHWRQRG